MEAEALLEPYQHKYPKVRQPQRKAGNKNKTLTISVDPFPFFFSRDPLFSSTLLALLPWEETLRWYVSDLTQFIPCGCSRIFTLAQTLFLNVWICVWRHGWSTRNVSAASRSGSRSTTYVTGNWCGLTRTSRSGSTRTATPTCCARRAAGPRWKLTRWPHVWGWWNL